MATEIISKRCSKCKQNKPLLEFSKCRRNKDGLRFWCKSCEKAYKQSERCKIAVKRYQQTEKGKTAKKRYVKRYCIRYPERKNARDAVNYAILVGKLSRPDSRLCHYCQKPAQQYHHWHGYEKKHRLDVVPACVECHKKEHRKIA